MIALGLTIWFAMFYMKDTDLGHTDQEYANEKGDA
jgi:hypothetical protein